MLINYGSTMYFVYLLSSVGVCFLLYFLLKNQLVWLKKMVVFLLALINFAQHVLKAKIYPQYRNNFSPHLSSAYNICAFLILISPFVILFGGQLLKNFVSCVGSFGGLGAILIPYWFIGKTAFSWEVYRFYICHALLFISSFLPVLLGLHKLEWKHCWKIGLLFFGMLFIILVNDAVLIHFGLYPVKNSESLFASLSELNPGWSMHPITQFDWLVDIIAIFTPSFFLSNNPWGVYIPILWYAIPLYLGITLLVYAICKFSKALRKSK
ncbi:MAG: hypothetical protein E7377_05970 [Clostridiales bacterium]|nr:hypothetical protein [Clostridiales bacterium]